MLKSRYTEEQIVGVLKESAAGKAQTRGLGLSPLTGTRRMLVGQA
jgi:hypothetical protein